MLTELSLIPNPQKHTHTHINVCACMHTCTHIHIHTDTGTRIYAERESKRHTETETKKHTGRDREIERKDDREDGERQREKQNNKERKECLKFPTDLTSEKSSLLKKQQTFDSQVLFFIRDFFGPSQQNRRWMSTLEERESVSQFKVFKQIQIRVQIMFAHTHKQGKDTGRHQRWLSF